MTADQRSIGRLPLHVFENLIATENDSSTFLSPEELRRLCCDKLRHHNTRRSGTTHTTTVGELLRQTTPSLVQALDPHFTFEECEEWIRRTCRVCTPSPCTAWQLLSASSSPGQVLWTTTGRLDRLQSALGGGGGGGIPRGSITEIVGRAGVGKTQWALQLAVANAQHHGGGTIYLDTEHKLSLPRLRQLAECATAHREEEEEEDRAKRRRKRVPATQEKRLVSTTATILDNIVVHAPHSTLDLLTVVSSLEEEILTRQEEEEGGGALPISLLVLDSIAAPLVRDFGSETAPQRVAAVFTTAQILKRLAQQLQLAVLVTNQVGVDNDNVVVQAALGTSWHHCVTTRILLQHQRDPHRLDNERDMGNAAAARHQQERDAPPPEWARLRGDIRTATVTKSNVAPTSAPIPFQVTNEGLCELPPE